MASKQSRAEARNPSATTVSSKGAKPLSVMAKDGSHAEQGARGCSDLRHPNLPYWHPLNGPFPSD